MYRLWALASFTQAALAVGAAAAAAYLAAIGADWWLALRDAGMSLVMGGGALLSLGRYLQGRNSNRRLPSPDNFLA